MVAGELACRRDSGLAAAAVYQGVLRSLHGGGSTSDDMTESRIEGAVFYPLTPDCDIVRVGPYRYTRCTSEDRITRLVIGHVGGDHRGRLHVFIARNRRFWGHFELG